MPKVGHSRTSTATLAAALFVAASLVSAETSSLPAPTGDVIMTVSGAIGQTNVDDTAQFDLDMIESLPSVEFTTSTIWTEGPQTFRGVPLTEFLAAVAADGEAISATTINDYSTTIPVSDAVEDGPIIAYMQNGDYMSRRDKGPLWIVYPYDASIEYRSEMTYSRSIWQLDRIGVE